jgi:drug/metabolite transporter (DMT)-like permease
MKLTNIMWLIILAAIWGGSFIFLRVLVPVFGVIGPACLRPLIAALFLLGVLTITRYRIHWKRDWKFLCVIGLTNSAIPFYLFSFAALHIPAAISVVINSMTPMFGAIFAVIILKERLSLRTGIGLILGMIGVAFISGSKALPTTFEAYIAIGACVAAALCYGFSGVLIQIHAKHIEAKSLAAGSQLFAGVSLLPFFIMNGVSSPLTPNIILTMIIFAVLSSGVAYLIYYYLIKEIGPTSTLSTMFIMPIFGILWGRLILGEAIYFQMIIGTCIILAGTYLVIKSRPSVNKCRHHDIVRKPS